MHLNLTGIALDPEGAQALRDQLGSASSLCADAFIAHLLDLGARFAVFESPYIDKDYSADYQNFYASAFRDYPRQAKRIHFFSEDVSVWFGQSLAEQASDEATAKLNKAYLGFAVRRPLQQGPIGRTVIQFPRLTGGLCVRPAARALFKVHFLGTKLEVSGAPFIQQDRRIGACAQAAIWIAARAVHTRHQRTGWHSIADITELATTPTDAELSLELPAGSMGLNPIHMIRALKGMGHQPLFHYFGDFKERAAGPPAGETIFRYLDSGMPVVLGMTGTDIAHAVAAVGYVEVEGKQCRSDDTYDSFVRAFVVHDDQRGPYRYMPLTKDDIPALPNQHLLRHGERILTADEVISHMFVPMPSRVFLRAENADIVARDFLDQQATGAGRNLLDRVTDDKAKTAIAAFFDKVAAKKIVRRTYLTSAGRYRHHFAKGALNEQIKSQLIARALPHFVWVTELLDPDAVLSQEQSARPIVGHIVVNATSSADPDNDLLLAHYPHVVVHNDVNRAENEARKDFAQIFQNDGPYPGRVRGF